MACDVPHCTLCNSLAGHRRRSVPRLGRRAQGRLVHLPGAELGGHAHVDLRQRHGVAVPAGLGLLSATDRREPNTPLTSSLRPRMKQQRSSLHSLPGIVSAGWLFILLGCTSTTTTSPPGSYVCGDEVPLPTEDLPVGQRCGEADWPPACCRRSPTWATVAGGRRRSTRGLHPQGEPGDAARRSGARRAAAEDQGRRADRPRQRPDPGGARHLHGGQAGDRRRQQRVSVGAPDDQRRKLRRHRPAA